jgi:hypothetical protein
MSRNSIGISQPEPYDVDEEEIQLMDTDETNLQLEEPTINPTTNVVNEEKQVKNNDDKTIEEEEEEENDKIPSLLVIEVCLTINNENK